MPINGHNNDVQTARAASVCVEMLYYAEMLEEERIPPTRMRNLVPLCMSQFKRIFSTTRIPGKECDTLKHWAPGRSRHIVVYCLGHFYRVEMYKKVRDWAVTGR